MSLLSMVVVVEGAPGVPPSYTLEIVLMPFLRRSRSWWLLVDFEAWYIPIRDGVHQNAWMMELVHTRHHRHREQ